MKKTNFIMVVLFMTLVSFAFFANSNSNIAIGQISSTTSSTTSSTSTSGTTGEISSTSSTTNSGILSSDFTGTWQAKIDKATTIGGSLILQSSRSILLKFCVDANGALKGFIDEPGLFDRAVIISQTVKSNNEVDLEIQDVRGRTGSLNLVLNEEGELSGTFSNGLNFIANEISSSNSLRACLDLAVLPSASSSSSSGSVSINLDSGFSGEWRGSAIHKIGIKGPESSSRSVKLNLCVDNGNVVGFVTLPGFFNRTGVITSSTIKSKNEVNVEVQDIKGRNLSLDLILNGSELSGTFSNDISFIATNQTRFNPGIVCLDFGILPDFDIGIDVNSNNNCTCKSD